MSGACAEIEGYGALSAPVGPCAREDVSTVAELRSCVGDVSPRVCSFTRGGPFDLAGDNLLVSDPHVIITGRFASTLPYVMGGGINVETHNVLLEHFAVRPGDEHPGSLVDSDGVSIWGPDAYNVALNHMGVTWAADEIVAIGGGAHDITIQWSIIAQGLCCSRRQFEDGECHCRAILAWEDNDRVSMHHNLIAFALSRTPAIGTGRHDFRYNVISQRAQSWVDPRPDQDPPTINWVGNMYLEAEEILDNIRLYGPPVGGIYMDDNLQRWQGEWSPAFAFDRDPVHEPIPAVPSPYDAPAVSTSKAGPDSAYEILANVGPLHGSAVDQAIIDNVIDGTNGWCDCITPLPTPDPLVCQRLCGPWPE